MRDDDVFHLLNRQLDSTLTSYIPGYRHIQVCQSACRCCHANVVRRTFNQCFAQRVGWDDIIGAADERCGPSVSPCGQSTCTPSIIPRLSDQLQERNLCAPLPQFSSQLTDANEWTAARLAIPPHIADSNCAQQLLGNGILVKKAHAH